MGFRSAALTTLLVLMSMVALGAAVYSVVASALEARVRARIEANMAAVLGNASAKDELWLIAEINRRTSPDQSRRYVYSIAATDGVHVAGDKWIKPSAIGWSVQDTIGESDTPFGGGRVLILTAAGGPGLLLSIGRDIQWITEAEDRLLEILMLAVWAGLVLAGLTSFVVNRLIARRLDVLASSASRIMEGNLAHRIPLTGARDDFDHLSRVLNDMLDRIHDLMSNLEQVTNDIAHDLRTPLGRLRQGLELARRGQSSREDYSRAIDGAIVEADGLLTTFTSLLRIAQIEAGARRSAFRAVDLGEVLRSVAEAYEFDAEESGHVLRLALIEGAVIAGDRDLLVQVFANLIENVLTHTPAGTSVLIEIERSGDGVVARVVDDGPGVPPAELGKIFGRFYRLESSRTTPGTGLGLSLAAAVAKLHGARVKASDNHPGLCVTLTFPAGTPERASS